VVNYIKDPAALAGINGDGLRCRIPHRRDGFLLLVTGRERLAESSLGVFYLFSVVLAQSKPSKLKKLDDALGTIHPILGPVNYSSASGATTSLRISSITVAP
jgi:hypothetical protein